MIGPAQVYYTILYSIYTYIYIYIYIYTYTIGLSVCGTALAAREVAVLVLSPGEGIEVKAAAGSPADAYVATAAELDEPWVKLLGHNGFLIAGTEGEAEALMQLYAECGDTFGEAAA